MRNALKYSIATVAMVLTASTAFAGNIVVHNATTTPVWVTIYNLIKQHESSYCLKPNSNQTTVVSAWQQANTGGAIYIRYEYKTKSDCTGSTTYDSHYGSAIGYPASGDINQWVPAH